MDYIRVTKDNLEKEHICCAISNNKDVQVSSKKAWLSERFDDGLVFLKSVERGKCFIEYIPAENAWNPIHADGYMYIDCLWVSGSFKGHGYSNDLLDECIRDSKEKGRIGLCILSTEESGYVLYYTSQCPFNGKYVPILETIAKEKGVPFKTIHLQSKAEAQNAPTPITTYAVFHDGEYVTNEQMNDKRFLKMIGK